MNTIKTENKISKGDIKKVCAYINLISGALLLSTYFYLQLFFYMNEKQTILEFGLQVTILVLGIVFTTIGAIFLRWEDWLNPKI